MWFSAEEIHTEALETLKSGNENSVVREIKQLLSEEFQKFEVEEIKYTASDLVKKLQDVNFRATSSRVAYILKKYFKLIPINSSYKKYYLSISSTENEILETTNVKGRYYTFYQNDFLN